MNNTIIYLLGFSGTGKYTIAKEICKHSEIKLVDNHLINIPIFTLIKQDGISPLPQRIWDNIGKIWDAVIDTMVYVSDKNTSFVMTNALIDQGKNDHAWFKRVENAALARNAIFVPVRLICSAEENKKRIVQPERALRMKEINPDAPARNSKNFTVLNTNHPNELTLDITKISASQAADVILRHTKNIAQN